MITTPSALRALPLFLVLVAAPALGQDGTADRVREMAARTVASAESATRPTQLTVTVGHEGQAVTRAILLQGENAPERHLAAVLARVAANPRDPAAARQTTAAFFVQGLGSDLAAVAGDPHLALALDLGGAPLEVNSLAPAVGGSRTSAFGTVADGLPVLLASRNDRLAASSQATLAAIQATFRGLFTFQGTPCDAAAVVYPRSGGSVFAVEVEPRCEAFQGAQGRLVFDVDQVTLDRGGVPAAARIARVPGQGSLAAGITGEAVFVPRLGADELWSRQSPGFLAYGATETGARTIDFAALHVTTGGAEACVPDAVTLCLDDAPGDGRFKVTMSWSTSLNGGQSGVAFATPLGEVDISTGGLLSFFRNNPEMLVKVLDGCSITNHFWVFGAPTTTLGYELRIEDVRAKAAGRPASDYLFVVTNVDGERAESFSDTSAFPTCDVP